MNNLKFTLDWSNTLLTYQNHDLPNSLCDLKLVGSDGYMWIHRAVVPKLAKLCTESLEITSDLSLESLDSSSSIIVLPGLTLLQVAKLALLLYTGEISANKNDYLELKPFLSAFGVSPTKLYPFPRNITNTRSSVTSQNNDLKQEQLTQRKVRGTKFIGSSHDAMEKIFIYGNGSTMAVPLLSQDEHLTHSPSESTTLLYDESGKVTNEKDKGFYCSPCSTIFCDSSDYLNHLLKCNRKKHQVSTPRAVKVESNYIKLERSEDFEQASDIESMGCINKICLICVSSCKDSSELIIHSNEVHGISPANDYDIGTWTCRRCKHTLFNPSGELSVFLQHVHNCGHNKRKRPSFKQQTNLLDQIVPMKRPRTEDYSDPKMRLSTPTGENCSAVPKVNKMNITNTEETVRMNTEPVVLEKIFNARDVDRNSQAVKCSKSANARSKIKNAVCQAVRQRASPKVNEFQIPKIMQVWSPKNWDSSNIIDQNKKENSQPENRTIVNSHQKDGAPGTRETDSAFIAKSKPALNSRTWNSQKIVSNVPKEGTTTRRWLKKRKTMAKSPAKACWTCRRCMQAFTMQKMYMKHECLSLKNSKPTTNNDQIC